MLKSDMKEINNKEYIQEVIEFLLKFNNRSSFEVSSNFHKMKETKSSDILFISRTLSKIKLFRMNLIFHDEEP